MNNFWSSILFYIIKTKKYQNINEYKKNNLLIENISTNNTNNQFTIIKDFLKQHTLKKLKPTKKEWKTSSIRVLAKSIYEKFNF